MRMSESFLLNEDLRNQSTTSSQDCSVSDCSLHDNDASLINDVKLEIIGTSVCIHNDSVKSTTRL